VLNIVFKVADDQGLLLLDLKDLRAMLQYVGDNRDEYTTMYGNVSTASIGAIQRALLTFEQEGGADIFGEPELDVRDWIRTDAMGRGMINILSSERLFQSPTTYGTFLLWMLTELYENLPSETLTSRGSYSSSMRLMYSSMTRLRRFIRRSRRSSS